MTTLQSQITSLELQLDILKKRNEATNITIKREIQENYNLHSRIVKLEKVAEAARDVAKDDKDDAPYKAVNFNKMVEALQALDEVKL